MSIVAWIIVGLLAGGIGRILTGSEKRGCLGTMAVGLVGALIGGALASWGFHEGIGGFGLRSIAIAALGAVLLLLVLQSLGVASRRR
jgi:uncharacterized membrane protein YeaQ/YmgE (transglycosylase-associated protein family)